MSGKISKAAATIVRLVSVAAVLSVLFGVSPLWAQTSGQSIIDCIGNMGPYFPNSNVFPSINQYLQIIGPIGTVVVNGGCSESITIVNGDQLNLIGAGTGAAILGNITINDSPDAVYLRNLTITNAGGDGIDINGSKVTLDSCNVSGNARNGVNIDNASFVRVTGTGIFDDNQASGFNVFGHSYLSFLLPGPVEIRRNKVSGIVDTQAEVTTRGNTIISDSGSGPGINLLGGARAQIGAIGAPNVVENNPNGGISVRENSELSLWTCCSSPNNVVTRNGQFGISAGFHSQVTLSGADVSNNTGPGVDVYAASQVDFYPGTQN